MQTGPTNLDIATDNNLQENQESKENQQLLAHSIDVISPSAHADVTTLAEDNHQGYDQNPETPSGDGNKGPETPPGGDPKNIVDQIVKDVINILAETNCFNKQEKILPSYGKGVFLNQIDTGLKDPSVMLNKIVNHALSRVPLKYFGGGKSTPKQWLFNLYR